MKISITKKVEIDSPTQWFHVAPPEGGTKQWKVGRSAFEMARFALSKEFPEIIKEVLSECGLSETGFTCEPEKTTSFEKSMGTGGPRHHDLLMIGDGDTIIGIEAKVSESFDKRIEEKRKGAKENMNLRLNSCLDYLYETRPKNAERLYYQLLSATIGSIIEAKNLNKHNVISLIIVFEGEVDKEKDYDQHVKDNEDAFKDFCSTFNLDEKGGKLPDIPKAPGINCWIKKIKVNITAHKKI